MQDCFDGQWAQVSVEGEDEITVIKFHNCFGLIYKPVLVTVMSRGEGTWVWVQVFLSISSLRVPPHPLQWVENHNDPHLSYF